MLEHHGWAEIGHELHAMSKERRWDEMPSRITDDMLDEWAIVAGRDDLAAAIGERCDGLFSTVLLDLAPGLRADEDWLAGIIRALQAG